MQTGFLGRVGQSMAQSWGFMRSQFLVIEACDDISFYVVVLEVDVSGTTVSILKIGMSEMSESSVSVSTLKAQSWPLLTNQRQGIKL